MELKLLENQLTPLFCKYHEEIVAAYLFGSTAEGVTTPSSDIDIAVLLHSRDKNCRAGLKLRLYADMCRVLKRNNIDLVVLSLSGNLILNEEIVRYGKILFSANDEVREDFELNVLHRCADFKSQRKYAMGV
jgi:predicted nucleotidyltransferase